MHAELSDGTVQVGNNVVHATRGGRLDRGDDFVTGCYQVLEGRGEGSRSRQTGGVNGGKIFPGHDFAEVPTETTVGEIMNVIQLVGFVE